MLSPTVLKVSPTVLNTLHSADVIPHCTDVIPPLYWTTSTVLKVCPHSTEAIPTCTAVIPPQYWRYPSKVLNTLHSTDVIPPMSWTTSNVLNNLHSTEPTLYGVNKKREAYGMFNEVYSLFSEHLVPSPILRSIRSQFLPFVCEITNAMHTLQNNSC